MVRSEVVGMLSVVQYLALGVAALMVAGIVAVMVLARGTGEDITGVAAPALLLAVLSLAVAIGAGIRRRRRIG
ncbi:hypothetical protein ACQP00_18490 [Dactylosporangium sp. CS-047395]|uniref:hypothetical protein n=1 Tax=Dactylosporangium sp. CS-047395 TaxID=3239936 RepID=UPI003D92E5B7